MDRNGITSSGAACKHTKTSHDFAEPTSLDPGTSKQAERRVAFWLACLVATAGPKKLGVTRSNYTSRTEMTG